MNRNKMELSFISTLLCIIFTGIIAYFIDILWSNNYYKSCINNIKFHTILLIHHIFIIFIFFGWLSNNRLILYIYILIPFILIIHWKTNNNNCFLTQRVNKICELNENEYIRDFLYFIGLKKSNYYDLLYIVFLCLTFFIVVYKLFLKSKT